MTAPTPESPKKRRPVDWTGTYQVLRDGSPVASFTITRQWTPGGTRHTATLDDGRSVIRGDGGFAVYEAARLVAPGEAAIPWHPGAGERGIRLRTEGRAPWEPTPAEEVTP